MNFDKLYVDEFFLRSLEKIAVSEKWIPKPKHMLYKRNYLKQKILLYLTLFDNIDSPSLHFYDADVSRFINEGIFDKHSLMFNESPTVLEIQRGLGEKSQYKSTLKIIEETAISTIRYYKYILIDLNDSLGDYYPYFRSFPLRFGDIYDHFEYLLETPVNIVVEKFPEMSDVKDDLDKFKYNLEQILFASAIERKPFAASYIVPFKNYMSENVELVNNVYYVVRTKLKNEIVYLPSPSTLNDVIKIRAHPSIKRFREVIAEWCKYLEEGNLKLECRARKDIQKANMELKRLTKYREFKNSPLNFWLNSIGGHIPILSNILSIVYMIGGLYEGYIEGNDSWLMIGS